MAYTIVSPLVGLLLLTAAGLKLLGGAVSPVAQLGRFAAPSFQMALILWEVLLGLWLISRVERVGAWAVAGLTFASFAVVSGYFGSIGQATCGCFGTIDASPWAAFGIDLVVLALLATARPSFDPGTLQARQGFHRWTRRGIGVGATVVAFFVLLAVIASAQFGSVEVALAQLKGDDLIVPAYVDFGEIEQGQEEKRMIEVTNSSDRRIRIVGGTSDCSCFVTEDLPIALEPRESRPIAIYLRAPKSAGMFSRTAKLLTDNGGAPSVAFRIGGRVK